MTLILKKNAHPRDVDKLLLALKKNGKGFDAKKYCGILKLNQDPVKTQRTLRNEWR